MGRKLGVIGVGNMAKAIISGVRASSADVDGIFLFDINEEQYAPLLTSGVTALPSVSQVIRESDCVLISVKPQNYPEVLSEISGVCGAAEKLYISIGAGITVRSVQEAIGSRSVVRVLPNVPMLILKGVSVICRNSDVAKEDFAFVRSVFEAAGSVIEIDESEMNRMIGVTSSSPAYVFKFINAIYEGARAQGLDSDDLMGAVCDVLIGSAELIKSGYGTPAQMVRAVASKGGTTERALGQLDDGGFDEIISKAMLACTTRADELGAGK